MQHGGSTDAAGESFSPTTKGIETRLEAPPLWHPVAPVQGKGLGRSRRHLPLHVRDEKGVIISTDYHNLRRGELFFDHLGCLELVHWVNSSTGCYN